MISLFLSHTLSAWHFFFRFFLISSSFTVINQLTAIQSSKCALCHSRPTISRKKVSNARTKSDPNETIFLLVIDGIKYRNDLAHFSNRNWTMDYNPTGVGLMKWAFLFPHDVFCLCLLSHTAFILCHTHHRFPPLTVTVHKP